MAKKKMKKLTIIVPEDLLRRARRATHAGITPTVRQGLEILAKQDAFESLRALRGKLKLGMTWQELRGDE
jgi:hypothetical protein